MSDHDHEQPFDRGLLCDLRLLNAQADRRRVLRLIGLTSAVAVVPLLGCSGSGGAGSGGAGAGSGGAGAGSGGAGAGSGGAGAGSGGAGGGAGAANSGSCSTIPAETGGPYPGDGTNGPNALGTSGIVRSDIRSSFGGLTGTAQGVPLTLTLKIVSASGSCGSLAGYAVYVWHCDRDSLYSMYTIVEQNYLRGVQEADGDGTVTFTSIYPACYAGRWPHVHFEVWKSLAEATAAASPVATSQLALPDASNQEAYRAPGYEASIPNYAAVSLSTDSVFSDGATSQIATVTGNATDGYTALLTVAVG